MWRFPLKKIRKQLKLLLLLVLLTFGIWFTYLHMAVLKGGRALRLHFPHTRDAEKPSDATDPGRSGGSFRGGSHPRVPRDPNDSQEDEQMTDDLSKYDKTFPDGTGGRLRLPLNLTQISSQWKPEYRGQVNLHVFEDWCGASINQLRKNIHFPLYPHTRTSVNKIAVAPKWKNYGLRIFGYIHPYKDGDFQFAIASDDNSELWLSPDEVPANARLLVRVGKLGTEWAAPGEFTKFRSQVSNPIHMIATKRYYFEALHKQDDKGSDHVEVGWRLFLPGLKFEVIDSLHISLYADESSLKMNRVDHIPQTLASHSGGRLMLQRELHAADMLKPDPRDTFFLTPAIAPSRIANLLPPCSYLPTYVVKDFPIARYQGLQFVYLSFVYPNDFTRLTHMETENKCFYRESPMYLERFGFYKYMKMDEEENRPFWFDNPEDFPEEAEGIDMDPVTGRDRGHLPRRKAISAGQRANNNQALGPPVTRRKVPPPRPAKEDRYTEDPPGGKRKVTAEGLQRKASSPVAPGSSPTVGGFGEAEGRRGRSLAWAKLRPGELSRRPGRAGRSLQPRLSVPVVPGKAKSLLSKAAHRRAAGPKRPAGGKEVRDPTTRPPERMRARVRTRVRERLLSPGVHPDKRTRPSTRRMEEKKRPGLGHKAPPLGSETLEAEEGRRRRQDKHRGPGAGREAKLEGSERRVEQPSRDRASVSPRGSKPTRGSERYSLAYWKAGEPGRPVEPTGGEEEEEGVPDYSYEDTEPRPPWAEEAVNWQRTFSVGSVDFELLRSDWNDLRCNVSGNLQLAESEVVEVLAQYMERLNARSGGMYTLLRIINMEKRRDSARGNRYLIEVELMERGQRVVRVSQYIYLLLHRTKQDEGIEANQGTPEFEVKEPSAPSVPYSKPVLCQPIGLQWRDDVMVHFVVPVKNQARWVQQFITDMEHLYKATKDESFNIIIIDFESGDMDVEQALKASSVPRYQYLKRSGSFERSAGLQAGADLIEDSHTILFLCDLHIHFPISILDNIRKHCLEGRLAYAPIVMRLGCGSSPSEPDGYWEVNGFGLFGIFKSDFDKVGGMNTEEFRDRWGGEDWELLDRVLQSGLEVERLRLRNFYHYYHSKRGMWDSQTTDTTKGASER
ncbi:LOW QUALITY PROTEIN: N-acetyl-beta-glucosaminyl-glycoprotein 4-beta-N-acetylgalactosaminyltransferase 1 [Callorhinchus milii]|uniref:LOW QUALITY PROTEIN: N-acetyl-beta-glucosaminyl-glycoprotein 4-beta-N-acetylgalactosaminyltransferase 1 n=1 Tax=Callorhinchus milii TaxID=7868 RepID=UPI001C3F55B6|nr:LOW QUALITY PROTEIN: N-acetyl-beta-glucosaminyl-glycoprotein 4-beta-N-acetylgalactosaminyltransferase 1 [Callorhinchus milii]